MEEQISEEILDIIKIEEAYGHQGFIYGIDTLKALRDKHENILNMLRSIENSDESSVEYDEAKNELETMILDGLLTSEALASIIIQSMPNSWKCVDYIESFLKNNSIVDYGVFCGIYYKNKCNDLLKLARDCKQQMLNQNNIIKQNEYINERYAKRYGDVNNSKWFRGKCAVYTVITGDYDDLLDPEVVNPKWDYYCFTDHPERFVSSIWKTKKLDNDKELSTILMQKKIKMMPWLYMSEYEYTIYIDGSIQIVGDLQRYINTYSKDSSLLASTHPTRQNLKDEVDAIMYYKRNTDYDVLKKQVEYYYSKGYRDQIQMINGGFLIRSNRDEHLKQVMERWWEEVNEWTTRDQISWGYCCWKNNFTFDLSNINIVQNPYIVLNGHK